MNKIDVQNLIGKQRKYFFSGATLSPDVRIAALNKLEEVIKENVSEIEEALHQDLGKSAFSAYMTEIGMVLDELVFMKRHLRRYSKKKRVYTPLAQMVATSYVKPSPYGCVLIMSPWNYPFLLTMDPLIDALSAGNTAILKPSAYSPNTSKVIEKIIKACFEPEYVEVVQGGREENVALLEGDFNYIFFTGSIGVGKTVMEKASKNLIPITLELGGKSPCIVDKTSNLKVAARRIVFGKYLNCGQTCVAPDYLYCEEDILDDLLLELEYEIQLQYGQYPLEDKSYGKIVNEKHFNRLMNLMDPEKVVYGGENNPKTLQIEPTIMTNVTWNDPIMKEEIFGPILPILTCKNVRDLIPLLQTKPSPLAFYLFTRDNDLVNEFESKVQFGGGCINDTIIQLATSEMGFGGVGDSGMGSYHGKAGFDTFSHKKSIVHKAFFPDIPIRYQPYNKFKEFFVKLFLH